MRANSPVSEERHTQDEKEPRLSDTLVQLFQLGQLHMGTKLDLIQHVLVRCLRARKRLPRHNVFERFSLPDRVGERLVHQVPRAECPS